MTVHGIRLDVTVAERLDASAWASLRSRVPDALAFLASGWCAAWAEAARTPLEHVSVRDAGGRLLAVCPLSRRGFGPLRLATLAGYYWPYRGIPAADGPLPQQTALSMLAHALDRAWRGGLGLRIGPVREDDPGAAAVIATLTEAGWSGGTRRIGNHFEVELPPTPKAFATRYRETLRKLGYSERRLGRTEPLEVRHYRGAGEDWPAVFADLAAVERESWVALKGGDTKFCDERSRRFWAAVAADPLLVDALRATMMRLSGEPVSFFFSLDFGTRKFILANGYRERVKTYTTGSMLAGHVLRKAVEDGVRTVDWGMGDNGYKSRWGAKAGVPIIDHVLVPPGLTAPTKRLVFARALGYGFG